MNRMNDLKLHSRMKQLYFYFVSIHLYALLFFLDWYKTAPSNHTTKTLYSSSYFKRLI